MESMKGIIVVFFFWIYLKQKGDGQKETHLQKGIVIIYSEILRTDIERNVGRPVRRINISHLGLTLHHAAYKGSLNP